MSVLIVLAALAGLIILAYRGHSVILVAPLIAMAAVALTDPSAVLPAFSGVFMTKMAGFVQSYFPVFLLGALFGKLMEISGFAQSIVQLMMRLFGPQRSIIVITLTATLLTYGGVSVFVVVFALYPFGAEAFRRADIPKRLLPGTIALGAMTYPIDALPGSPQIQNIIPTTFFGTTSWAAPGLGLAGSAFILGLGLLYLERSRLRAARRGEGYGTHTAQEPEIRSDQRPRSAVIAILPLVLVAVVNFVLTRAFPALLGGSYTLSLPGMAKPAAIAVGPQIGIWSVLAGMVVAILFIVVTAWPEVRRHYHASAKPAIAGALLATMNTASEFGFGAIIAILPGFLVISHALSAIPDPLVNEALTINILSGITGSAAGGLSIALAAMADQFIAAANANGIPMEVLHRVAAMAAGGMDTLPHNGAIITLLSVTGMTHRQAYGNIFVMTLIKVAASFLVIALYYATGLV
ncbi:GntP family permease [Pseudooceanicola sp. CBS1P-1]|uniref:GntP family permease n=1 Tax=Pseudooceanicola albus TaxID=2692189 RepID=A0A6L7GA32_9RHOB|nr:MULTISPECIES: GntP family permease [Pseudooceanicola]MBT9386454.1 GntP family permease [Pseudooceanicola endophyticus]MXN20388.1 GntP family permease [Pseudooceanicola albus]